LLALEDFVVDDTRLLLDLVGGFEGADDDSFFTGLRLVTVPDFLVVVIIETVGGLLPTRFTGFVTVVTVVSDSSYKRIKLHFGEKESFIR